MTSALDTTSWQAIATRLRPFIVRRVASEADAEDVLQEVLLRMHRGLSSLADDERLTAWMYRIARNAIADQLRMRLRHPLSHQGSDEEGFASDPEGSEERRDHEVSSELAGSLGLFIARLPSPYREAVTLTELEGLTQKEAAQRLGISLSGMKSRVQRGRAKIRHMLEACCAIALDARGRPVACAPLPVEDAPEGCCRSQTAKDP